MLGNELELVELPDRRFFVRNESLFWPALRHLLTGSTTALVEDQMLVIDPKAIRARRSVLRSYGVDNS